MFGEDRLLLDLVAANLGKRGCQVTATSLEQGDRHLWAHLGAELLLLDVEPPGRDAVEAVRCLGDLGWGSEVPVVALCDEVPNGDVTEHRAGVRWVVKPFTVDVLLSTVRLALRDVGVVY